MAVDFPELTSFGTLLKFALAIEQAAADLAGLASSREACAASCDELARCAKKHQKRGRQLERLRQERLNEVVLQPIDGMERARYVPALELPQDADAGQTIALVASVEEAAARFYDDAAEIAANVLTGVDRTFTRLARESRSLATKLSAEK